MITAVTRAAAARRRRARADAMAPWMTYALAGAAVGVTAAAGGRAVDPGVAWYRGLAKPLAAIGTIWTPPHMSIAWPGGHALRRTAGRRHRLLMAPLGVNPALNAGWNWLF